MLTEEALKYLRSLDGYNPVTLQSDVYPSQVIAIPEKSKLESLERFQVAPNRIKHRAKLVSSAAFIAYVNRFKGADTSIYLDLFGDEPSFAAVLDHHGPAAPSWSEHRATFVPQLSLEWNAWKKLHERGPIKQADLVAFIEDHFNDLDTPSPGDALMAAQRFEQVEKHTYDSAVNLDNGNVQFTYIKAGNQRKLEFPHTLKLWILVLENEKARFVEGRLRYRTAEGNLAFVFQLKEDPERVERDALRQIAGDIKGACEGCHHYEGEIG